jgi:hypothetical protein
MLIAQQTRVSLSLILCLSQCVCVRLFCDACKDSYFHFHSRSLSLCVIKTFWVSEKNIMLAMRKTKTVTWSATCAASRLHRAVQKELTAHMDLHELECLQIFYFKTHVNQIVCQVSNSTQVALLPRWSRHFKVSLEGEGETEPSSWPKCIKTS